MPIAAGLVAALVGTLISYDGGQADANEYGTSSEQVTSTTGKLTSPSGLVTTANVSSLISDPGVTNSAVGVDTANPDWFDLAEQTPQTLPGMKNAIRSGIGGGAGGSVYAYPQEWSFDNKWHPAYRTTFTFDRPVVDPVMYLGTQISPAVDYQQSISTGSGLTSQQLQITGAQGPGGQVPVTPRPLESFNSSLYEVDGNTITPRPINGRIPYLSGHAIYCDPDTPKDAYTEFPAIGMAIPGSLSQIKYISGPCGSIQLDTGGKAISTLTVDTNLSYLAASVRTGGFWNGAGYTATVFNFSTLTELSGSTTPPSLGAATHTVGDLRLGTDIKPAATGMNLTEARAGTPQDNSDAGYMPESEIQHATLTNKSKGTFTVSVPYSGLSSTAYLNGWIDFNGNGTWDGGESASTITTLPAGSSNGNATLSFAIPSDIAITPTGGTGATLRLRTAYDQAEVHNPTGMARSGEVEDHFIQISDGTPDLLVKKTATPQTGTRVAAGDNIKYEITVTNQSTVDANAVTVVDTLPAGLTYLPDYSDSSDGLTYDQNKRTISWGPADIAKGQTLTLTLYARADSAGVKENTATASSPDGCVTSGTATACTDTATIEVNHAGRLTLAKTTPDLPADAVFTLGQRVTYRLTVTNPGPETITNITVTDPKLAGQGQSCQLGTTTLKAGQDTSCDLTYVVTQRDIDTGWILNRATTAGTFTDKTAAPGDDAEKRNDTDGERGKLVIEKSSVIKDKDGQVKELATKGDTITYTVVATNDSSQTMNDVQVNDPLLPTIGTASNTCALTDGTPVRFPLAELPARSTITCTGNHVVEDKDVDAGHVYNKATGSGSFPPDPDEPETPIPTPVVPGEDDVPVGGLAIAKQSTIDGQPVTAASAPGKGDVIDYRVTVRNTTDFPMTKVVISDPSLTGDEALSCSPDPKDPATGRDLDPRATVECTGSHTVTQADVDAGHVRNTATASGSFAPNPDPADPRPWPDPQTPIPSPSATTDDPTARDEAGIVINKSAEVTSPGGVAKEQAAEDDTITYTIKATNAGNVTISDLAILDSMFPALGAAIGQCKVGSTDVTLPVASLAPGASIECTHKHRVTAGDVAAGKVYNKATAEGTIPGPIDPSDPGAPVDPIPVPVTPDEVTVPGGLVVDKVAKLGQTVLGPGDQVKAGQVITYEVTIKNPTPFDMVDVTVTDPMLAQVAPLDCANTPRALAAGAQFVCTANYTVTQADVDARHVPNTATAEGGWAPASDPKAPQGPVNPASDSTDTPTEYLPGNLAMDKSSTIYDAADTAIIKQQAELGDRVDYRIVARNTSNVTMKGVSVYDDHWPKLGEGDSTCMVDGAEVHFPLATLAPGAQIVCTYSYPVTADDVKAGHVLNVATGDGTMPPDKPDKPDIPIIPTPDDDEIPAGTLQVVKTSKVNGTIVDDSWVDVGARVDYTIVVTNPTTFGMVNVRLTDELLTDPETGEPTFTCDGNGTLAPKASMTCTGSRVVTEADKVAGKITNVAIANADWGPDPDPDSGDFWPTGPVEPAQDEVDNLVPRDVGRLDIDKRAKITGADGKVKQTAAEGDAVTYTITATNTSDQVMKDVQLTDALIPDLGKADCTIGGSAGTLPAASLAAGEKIVCTGAYRVTAKDVAAGHILNVATGSATTPDPKDPGQDVPADVTPGRDDVPAGTLEVVKTAKLDGVSIGGNQKLNLGDTIDYQIVVTNPTTFGMVNVNLVDPMLSGNGTLSCPDLPAVLAPLGSLTCTGSYVITQEDVDAGHVENVATGSADWAPNPNPDANPDWPTGKVDPAKDDTDTKTDPGSDKLVIEKSAQIEDAKSGAIKQTAFAGDEVTYTVTATNTSKRTMLEVSIQDTMFSAISDEGECTLDGSAVRFPVPTLAPGGVITCTETHRVTQDDVDAGHVYNQATGSGKLPDPQDPPPVTPVPDDVDYPVGGLEVTKKSFLGQAEITDQKVNLGETVTYRVSVHNPTTYDMTKVALRDDLLGVGGLTCPGAKPDGTVDLKARSTITCTGQHQVTQADVDAGHVLNVALATGEWVPSADPKDPVGPVPPGTDRVDDPTDPGLARIEVAKTAEIRDGSTGEVKTSALAGDKVTYTITATNASKQTMSKVMITDEMFPGLGAVSGCAIEGQPVTIPTTLAPGKTVSCHTPVHTVTAKEAKAGHVHNVAIGSGELPPKPDEPQTPVIPTPGEDEADYPVGGLALEKTSFLGTTPITTQKVELGEVITYSVTVTNTSTYRIDRIQVADAMLADAGITMDCGRTLPTALDGGKSFTCTARYTVTQDDVDAGHVVNLATATGSWAEDPENPDGPSGDVPSGSDRTEDPTAREEGSLEITKTSTIADRHSKAVKTQAAVGDRITYTITAKNTSNLTLSNVRIEDALLPELGSENAVCSIDRPAQTGVRLPTRLAPGATLTCVDSYLVTEPDGVKGRVTNVAIAKGDLPGPLDPAKSDESGDPKPIDPAQTRNDQPTGGLVVEKVATPSPEYPGVGQTIRYRITVSNTTDYPIENVALADSLLDKAGIELQCDADKRTQVELAAHSSFSCTADYPVTQADVDAGRVLNTATATGQWGPKPPGAPETNWPTGDVEPDADSTTTPTAGPVAGNGLEITKDAVVNGGAKHKAGLGDVISFAITATNTSNRTMSDVRLRDEMLAKAGVTMTCQPGNPVASLAPQAKITCTADYTVTVADVNRGTVHNVATGSGKNPDGTDVPVVPDGTDTDTEESPGLLAVTKTADVDQVGAGQTFGYTIQVTNASKDQVAKTVTVNDQLEKYLSFVSADKGGSYNASTHVVTWKIGPIQPGQSVSVTMKVKTSADLPANATVKNVARAATPTGCSADAPGNCTGESIIPSGSAAGAPLAHTGANIAIAAMIALALLVMGWLLAGPSRRRRPVRR